MNYLNKNHDAEVFTGRMVEGIKLNGDDLTISFIDGSIFEVYHYQDCCESVYSVILLPINLIGKKIIKAEKIIDTDLNNTKIEAIGFPKEIYLESCTLTTLILEDENHFKYQFYWLVVSNGYYNEQIDIRCIKEPNKYIKISS